MVARSRSHSSPGCVPSGVILTFCAQAGTPAAESPSASILIPKCFIRMTSSPRKRPCTFLKLGHGGAASSAGRLGYCFISLVTKSFHSLIASFAARAVDHDGIFLLSNEFLDAGLVFAYGLVELV